MGTVLQHLLALLLLGFFIFVIWYARHTKRQNKNKDGVISDEVPNEKAESSIADDTDVHKKVSRQIIEHAQQLQKLNLASRSMDKSEFLEFAKAHNYIYYNKPEENVPLLMESYSSLPFRQMLDARQEDKRSYFEMTLMMKYQDIPSKVLSDIAALAVQHYSIGFRECLQYLLEDMRRTKRSVLKKDFRSLKDYGVAVDACEEKNM